MGNYVSELVSGYQDENLYDEGRTNCELVLNCELVHHDQKNKRSTDFETIKRSPGQWAMDSFQMAAGEKRKKYYNTTQQCWSVSSSKYRPRVGVVHFDENMSKWCLALANDPGKTTVIGCLGCARTRFWNSHKNICFYTSDANVERNVPWNSKCSMSGEDWDQQDATELCTLELNCTMPPAL